MDILIVVVLLAVVLHIFKTREQAERVALLGSYLGKFQIEKLMQEVLSGYDRALSESDADRQAQVWRYLQPQEQTLADQFSRFVLELADVYEARVRVSRLPLALPFLSLAMPSSTFDLRKLMGVHGHGLNQAVANAQGLSAKRRAFAVTAELLLMQHSCHWFCRSKLVASARLLARHQTAHVQVLEAVTPQTRQAYLAVIAQPNR
jgi:AcrR family transcriptional regulator